MKSIYFEETLRQVAKHDFDFFECQCFSMFLCNVSESMVPLLPSTAQSQVHMLVPNRTFDLSYDLNCAAICSDFQENIEFQFSLGWKALVHRYLGSVNAQKALKMVDPNFQVSTGVD